MKKLMKLATTVMIIGTLIFSENAVARRYYSTPSYDDRTYDDTDYDDYDRNVVVVEERDGGSSAAKGALVGGITGAAIGGLAGGGRGAGIGAATGLGFGALMGGLSGGRRRRVVYQRPRRYYDENDVRPAARRTRR